MKNLLLKISFFFLLFAVSAETASSFWVKAESFVILSEKGQKEENKKGESEKDDMKDKLFRHTHPIQIKDAEQTFFVLKHINFKYSSYLSLPEIPPELT